MPYRKIDTRIWNDEKFRKLSPEAQRMYLYLLTSPHSTPWGAYIIDDLYIQADLSMQPGKIKSCWDELATRSLTVRCKKTRLVCFPNWFRYNPPPNEKSANACIKGILDLPRSPVLLEFCEKSEWVRTQLANRSLTVRFEVEDEQKQKQEQNIQTPTVFPPSDASDPSEADEEVPFIQIPLVTKNGEGNPEEFSVTDKMIGEWEELFPAVDIRQALRDIRAWNLANPKNRKTRAGILRHIIGWLKREQDRARRSSPTPHGKPQPRLELDLEATRAATEELRK